LGQRRHRSGARLCAQRQPQRSTTPDGLAGAKVLRLVETIQPRPEAQENRGHRTLVTFHRTDLPLTT